MGDKNNAKQINSTETKISFTNTWQKHWAPLTVFIIFNMSFSMLIFSSMLILVWFSFKFWLQKK